MTVTVATVQMTSGPGIDENLRKMDELVRQAAGQGAAFIVTPESSCHIVSSTEQKLAIAPEEGAHPGVPAMQSLAAELGVWIQAGSFTVRAGKGRLANRSYVFSPLGTVAATYDKIHLFDVDVAGDRSYKESELVEPGARAVACDLPWGRVGLSVCYDLRFPHLYRALAQVGAVAFTVPAAFTVPTGEAHWHVLLRARAIENGAYVIAAGQTGVHDGGRRTYGHSMIVGPWGNIIAEGGTEEGVILAQINPDEAREVRARLPSLRHDRDFTVG